jgi:hypothetical protein
MPPSLGRKNSPTLFEIALVRSILHRYLDRKMYFIVLGKGIAPGHDADLVMIRLGQNERVEGLLYRHAVSPDLGRSLEAVVVQTWGRGRKVYRDGKISDGIKGRFLRPSLS